MCVCRCVPGGPALGLPHHLLTELYQEYGGDTATDKDTATAGPGI